MTDRGQSLSEFRPMPVDSYDGDAGGAAISSMSSKLPTGMVTFLMSDVEGSTRLWETGEAATAEAISRHYELIHTIVAAAPRATPARAGGGRQRRGGVRETLGRRRGSAGDPRSHGRGAMADRVSVAGPNSDSHRRDESEGFGELLRTDDHPLRTNEGNRPRRTGSGFRHDPRPRIRPPESRCLASPARYSPTEGPRHSREGLAALPPDGSTQTSRSCGPSAPCPTTFRCKCRASSDARSSSST